MTLISRCARISAALIMMAYGLLDSTSSLGAGLSSDDRVPARLVETWGAPTVIDLYSYLQAAAVKDDEDGASSKVQPTIASVKQLLDNGASGANKLRLRRLLAGLYAQAGRKAYTQEQAQSRATPVARPDHRISTGLFIQAVDTYRQLLTESTVLSNNPKIALELGLLLAVIKSPNAQPSFESLISQKPSSKEAPRAWLALAEVQFEAGRYPEARISLAKAASTKDETARTYARYRLAWDNLRAKSGKAVQDQAVVTWRSLSQEGCQAEQGGALWLCSAASDDLVALWGDRSEHATADAFFSERKNSERYYLTLERTASRQMREKQLLPAITTLRTLAKAAPTRISAPGIYLTIADLAAQAGDRPGVISTLNDLYATCVASDGAWTQAHADAPKQLTAARMAFAKKSLAFGQQYHRESRLAGEHEVRLAAAIAAFGLYLNAVPNGSESYQARYLFAQDLAEAKLYTKAVTQYFTVAKSNDDHAVNRVPATDAMLAIQLQLAAAEPLRAQADWQQLKAPAAVPPNQAQLVEIIDFYASVLPDRANVPELQLKASMISFASGQVTAAEKRVAHLAKTHPQSPATATGIRTMVSAHAQRQEWDLVIAWSKGFLARSDLDEPSLRKFLENSWRDGAWSKAEGLAATRVNPTAAARAYERFASDFPRDANADNALAKASLQWISIGRGKEAIDSCQNLVTTYGNSNQRVVCMQTIANVQEQLLDYGAAAAAYSELATAYPKDPGAANALAKASGLYLNAQNIDLGTQSATALVRLYPRSEVAAPTLLRLAEAYVKGGYTDSAVKLFDQYAAQYAAGHAEEALYANAMSASLLQAEHSGQAERRIAAVEGELTRAGAKSGGKAREVLAELRLSQAQSLAENLRLNGVDATSLIALEESYKQLRSVLQQAEGVYQRTLALNSGAADAAAHYHLGCYYEGALTAASAPLPTTELNQTEQGSASALREAFILDVRSRMQSHWTQGLKSATSSEPSDRVHALLQQKLAKYTPALYRDKPEMLMAPVFTSHHLTPSH